MAERIDATLVAGGRYHDIDFARRELLGLLGEHDHVRVTVLPDYEDVEKLAASAFVVSYTCDLRPSEAAQRAVADWVRDGGRWLALHGTNAALDIPGKNGVEAPRCFPLWAEVLGSQFLAHPPIVKYPVEFADADHWLVSDIEPFETDDELYLMEHHDRDELVPLLHTHWAGKAHGFEELDWSERDDDHLISYLRPYGAGAVLYNTLGHCRGHWDMVPLQDYFPDVERCSWEKPQYYELLRRGIRWAMGDEPESSSS
jgi:type 1 glutamine amidotransferase